MEDAAAAAEGPDGPDGGTIRQTSQSYLLAAGRLEAQLAIRPDQTTNVICGDIITCSIDNLLAIVDTPLAIRLVHLSSSNRVQSLDIQEKPYLLKFSPHGDALFAAFRGSKICCLWTRTGQALNEWRMKHTWTDWHGKVLDLQWFGAPRKWSPSDLIRKPARGPQFATERTMKEVGGLFICESGQMNLFQGCIEEDSRLQLQTIGISIPMQEKIAKAAIGFVVDESTALVAYTKRMSSEAALPRSSAEGDALGMFFEGADEVINLNQQQDESSQLDDGQDKVELAEVRIDLASSPLSLLVRLLGPIYLSSYDARSMPLAGSLTQLLWLESEDHRETEGPTNTKMNLFGAFYSASTTTWRTWQVQREEVEILSEAFACLEVAKSRSNEEEREDWISTPRQQQSFPDYIGNHYQSTPSMSALLCSWTQAPQASSLSELVKPHVEHRLINLDSLELLSDQNVLPTLHSSSCVPALSSNGCLAAQIVQGKVRIIQTPKEARWTQDDALAYWPGIVNGQDISDVRRTCPCNLEAVSSANQIHEDSFQQVSRLISLASQSHPSLGADQSNNSRLLLELVQCNTVLREAERGNYFEPCQIWFIISIMEWIISMVETLAKQAYLEEAISSVSSPEETKEEEATHARQSESNLLTLMTHVLPRKVLALSIVRIVKFCNWLSRVNRCKEEVKTMMNNVEFRRVIKESSNKQRQQPLWSLADNLRLAQMKINEMLIKSAVDLSQFGRVLNSYKKGEQDGQRNGKWFASLDKGDCRKVAKMLIEGHCIKTALLLFCPGEGEEDDEGGEQSAERDILTKAKLNLKAPYMICLSCKAKTQLTLALDQKCVCASHSWWKIL